jgi:hypothetical protein
MDSLSGLIAFGAEQWKKPAGLVAALVATLIGVVFVSSELSWPLWAALTLSGVSLGLVSLIWWSGYRLPRPQPGKIAIAVAIAAHDEEIQKTVKEDFLITFRKELAESASGGDFQFIEIAPHHAQNCTDSLQADRLTRRGKFQFLLFGRVRQVSTSGRKQYVIDLNGQVAHRPMSAEHRRQLSDQFREVLPGRIQFEEEGDLFHFELTTQMAHTVAKYSIGVAMAFSGAFDQAEVVLSESQQLATKTKGFRPHLARIQQRVPHLIEAIHSARSRVCYEKWVEERSQIHWLEESEAHLGKINPASCRFDVLTSRAVCAFALRRDARSARAYLTQIPKENRDALWYYNEGFLHAYEGNMKKASQRYRTASYLRLPEEKIWELETFMQWVVDLEPGRYQLHFVLAQFNLDIKRDQKRARLDYEAFLQAARPGEFEKEVELAWARIRLLEKQHSHEPYA